jgi:GNAT superfamily N-acetyltransferase
MQSKGSRMANERLAGQDGSIEIRLATPDDAAALAEVGIASFRDAYSAHSNAPDMEAHIEQYFSDSAVRDRFAQGQCSYYLAEVDGWPAGIALVRMAACPVPGGDDNALELHQLYVLASVQRHGLGRRLMECVVAHAEEHGARGVWLSAWEFADWATRFYSKAGFKSVGKVKFKLGSTSFTDLLMWRPLS